MKTWNKYPDVKPPKDGCYLTIWHDDHYIGEATMCEYENGNFSEFEEDVKYWFEIPDIPKE